MNNILLIKIVNFFSFLFLILNFILLFMNITNNNSLFFLYIIIFSFVLYKLKLKNTILFYISFIFLVLPLFFYHSIIHILFIITVYFCAFYFIFYIIDNMNYSLLIEQFTKEMYVLLAVIITGLIAQKTTYLSKVSGPYIISFLISSIMLLRTSRYINYNGYDKKIGRINLIYSILITALTFILSSDSIRQKIILLFTKIYYAFIDAFMFLFSWLFILIGYALVFLIDIFKKIVNKKSFKNMNIQNPQIIEDIKISKPHDINFISSNPILNIILKSLVFIIIIYLIAKIFKSQYNLNKTTEFYTEKKEYIKENKSNFFKNFKKYIPYKKTKNYNELIRFYYLKFIKKSILNKIEIKNSDTTFEINKKCEKIYDRKLLNDIRNIYIKIRYEDKKADKKMAKDFYEHYKKLKANKITGR